MKPRLQRAQCVSLRQRTHPLLLPVLLVTDRAKILVEGEILVSDTCLVGLAALDVK